MIDSRGQLHNAPGRLEDLVRKNKENLLALGHDLRQATELPVELHVKEATVPVDAEHGMQRADEILRVGLFVAEKEVVALRACCSRRERTYVRRRLFQLEPESSTPAGIKAPASAAISNSGEPNA